jgi:hypothetical protein
MRFNCLKSVIFLGILFFCFHTANAQLTPLDSCKVNFITAWKKLEASRDSNRVLSKDNKKLSDMDSASQMQVKELTLANEDAENQIQQFKNREAKIEIPPLISWDGFYICGISYYTFDPSNITNQFIKVLRWAISGEFNFKVLDKLKLVLEPMIPIGDKFRIQAKAGWRLF